MGLTGITEITGLGKEVIIICTIITNNNYNKPTINVDNIINCSNMYNEKLEIVKRYERREEKDTKYIIKDSVIVINE